MSKEFGNRNERGAISANIWGPALCLGGMAAGLYFGLQIGREENNVVTFDKVDCVEHSFSEGDRADTVAQELGANPSGEVSSAIYDTLDDKGYGRIEVCRDGSTWFITDLDAGQ